MLPDSAQPDLVGYIADVKEQFERLQNTCRKFFVESVVLGR